jgi:SAM-dependent methyltransferase
MIMGMNHDFDKDYWDKHYRKIDEKSDQQLVSPHLFSAVSELAPSVALDAGCGEGADALWLAKTGWKVTAVDISSAVLEKAKGFAEEAGAAINFQSVDLTSWVPEHNHYDLVTSHYVHTTDNQSFVKKLGSAVKVGGTLLIVGHQPSDNTHEADHHARGSHTTAEEIASYFDGDDWEVKVAEPRTISKTAPNGKSVLLNDSVFIARKKGPIS